MNGAEPLVIHLLGLGINLTAVLLWGGVATIVLSLVSAGSRWLGLSRMSMPLILGSMLSSNRNRAVFWGLGLHAVNGWLSAFVYALLFESLGMVSWWLGAVFGLTHGLFVLTVLLPVIPGVHPHMATERQGPTATRVLEPPGFLALHYGRQTPVVILVSHIAFGTILGLAYRLV